MRCTTAAHPTDERCEERLQHIQKEQKLVCEEGGWGSEVVSRGERSDASGAATTQAPKPTSATMPTSTANQTSAARRLRSPSPVIPNDRSAGCHSRCANPASWGRQERRAR